MKIGWVGLGKLGRPIAEAIALHGHDVRGYDLLDTGSPLQYERMIDVVEGADLVFCAVQTPHEAAYEGVTRIPDTRRDFDYRYLQAAVKEISQAADEARWAAPLVIISTVLPGTMEREIAPVLSRQCPLVYNPFFIAMGTEVDDFLQPEFVLCGGEQWWAKASVEAFYRSLHDRPLFWTDVRTAELTKVAYNTFIGLKIVFANTMMEICEKTGADVDDLADALELATDRIVSPRYMRAGMGDGGGCHPRDNIALSWLARELELSHDLFTDLMEAREDQTEWLADLAGEHCSAAGLPLVVLGKSYKAGSPLTVGSPALLLANLLRERGWHFDHLDPYAP